MTRLTWGNTGERYFETGVDRGVLYIAGLPAVPWNGLTSVSESPSGGEAKPYYLDGLKYLNIAANEEFEATIEAYTAPPEFNLCDGVTEVQNGLFVGQQTRRAFGFSYRTMLGNDVDPNMGYKIHLIYNALASPSEKSNGTLNDSPEAMTLSWGITTLPPSLTGYKPTAHLVIDSRKTPRGLLKAIEDILYGTVSEEGRLPMPSELFQMFFSEGPLMRTNVFPNPRFVATGASIEVRRNLVLNPAYRAPMASAEMRRNLAINPSVEGTSGWLSNNTNNWTHSYDTTVFRSGTRSLKAVPIGASIGGTRTVASIYLVGGSVVNVSPGEILSLSAYVSHNTPAAEANIFVQFLDGASAVVATHNQNVWIPLATTGFTRVSFVMPTATPVPAGAVTARVMLNVQRTLATTLAQSSDAVWVDDCLIEKAPVLLPYFDGRTSSADWLTYSWTGTADASASIASGAKTYTYCFQGYVRPSWTGIGTATDGSNTTLSYVGSSSIGTALNSLLLFSYDQPALAPGEYAVGRFRARLRNATAPITITPQLRPYAASSLGLMGSGPNVVIPQDGSWVDVTVTTNTAAAPATTTSVRLYVTSVVGDLNQPAILEISNVLVEKSEANTVGSWFDGNTSPSLGRTYAWTGLVDNSPVQAMGKPASSAAVASSGSGKGWQTEDGFGIYIQHRGSSYTVTQNLNFGANVGSVDRVSYSFDAVVDVDCEISHVVNWGPSTYRTYNTTIMKAGEPQRIIVTAIDPQTAPAGNPITMFIGFHPPAIVTSKLARLRVDNLMMAVGDDVGTFFDGNTPDADKNYYSWAGTPNNSVSYLNTWN